MTRPQPHSMDVDESPLRTRDLTDAPELERLLDRYGVAFICANPQILSPTYTPSDPAPSRPQARLDRLTAGYRILDEIYAPDPVRLGRRASRPRDAYGARHP